MKLGTHFRCSQYTTKNGGVAMGKCSNRKSLIGQMRKMTDEAFLIEAWGDYRSVGASTIAVLAGR